MTTKEIGDVGENAAVRFLKKEKYKISARNKHLSHNEIDIVAENKEYIVFVEVKTRTINADGELPYGVPSSSVTYKKKTHLLDAARVYLRESPTNKQPRMDVIEVWLDDSKKVVKINHIRNAYGAKG